MEQLKVTFRKIWIIVGDGATTEQKESKAPTQQKPKDVTESQ